MGQGRADCEGRSARSNHVGDKADDCQGDCDPKHDPGGFDGKPCNAAEPEESRNQRNDEERNGPVQEISKVHLLLLSGRPPIVDQRAGLPLVPVLAVA